MRQIILRSKQILGMILVIYITSACQRNNGSSVPEISISGEIRNAANTVIHLSELDVRKTKPIDSVTLDDDGRFSFKINPSGSMFLLISAKPGQQIILVANPGEKIHLEGNARELVKTSSITGSPASILMLEFERYTQQNQQKADSLGQEFLNSRADPGFAIIREHIDSAYEALASDQRSYMERFINKYPSSLASLIVLNRKFGPNAVFKEDIDLGYFLKIDSGLMKTYPGNKHAIDHHIRVEALLASKHKSIIADSLLTPGMPAPNVRLQNEEGFIVPLSTLKGKVVLVYFWAAMDAQSRKFIRKLIPLYKANRKRGFEIFGLALEPNRSLWLNAVKLDKPGGIQVNAGSGLNAPEAILFGVKKLPESMLIDRDGKISERNVSLDQLRNELQKLLK